MENFTYSIYNYLSVICIYITSDYQDSNSLNILYYERLDQCLN